MYAGGYVAWGPQLREEARHLRRRYIRTLMHYDAAETSTALTQSAEHLDNFLFAATLPFRYSASSAIASTFAIIRALLTLCDVFIYTFARSCEADQIS